MRALSPAELEQVVKRRIRWCQGWRHPDLWPTLSERQQALVGHVFDGALSYHDELMRARRERAERLREGPV
jgi:hypothetical protein